MTALEKPPPTHDLDTLWKCFGDELLRFATVLVGPTDAHDVTIDAFVRAASSSQHADIVNQRAYLFRSVANEASNWRRGRQRRSARELRQLGPGTTSGPDSTIDVRRAVADLSVRQRAVVYLIYWEDLTPSDAADVAELGQSTPPSRTVPSQKGTQMTDQLDHSIRTALKEIADHAPRAADVRLPLQVSHRPLTLVGETSNRGSSRPARPGRLVLIGLATAAAFTGIAVINSGTADSPVPNVAMVMPVRLSLTTAPAPAAPRDPEADSLVLLAPATTPAGYRPVAARTQPSSAALTGTDLTLDEVDAGVVVGTARVQADEEWWFEGDRNDDFERIANVRIGDSDGELLRNRATSLTDSSGQEIVLRYRVEGMPVAIVGYSTNPELGDSLTKVAEAITVAADGTVSVSGALPDRYSWNQRADQAPSELLGYESGASVITMVVETDARSTDRDWTMWGGIATPLEPTTVGGQVVYVGPDIVVWTERPGVFVQVGGQGVTIDELLAFAGSLSDIDATQWNQLTATIAGS